jgi:hypothetical protein
MITSHAGISPAGQDVFCFQPRITMKDRVGRITRSQHTKDMFDSEPAVTSHERMIAHLRREENLEHGNETDKVSPSSAILRNSKYVNCST